MTTEVDQKIALYQEYSTKLNTLYNQKTNSLSQYNENTLVKGELDLLTDENIVYKLVGPALVCVDQEEAKQNVAKRLEFIEAEIKKIDNQLESTTNEQNALGEEIVKLQKQMQLEAAEGARKIAEANNTEN
eukprot:TRINITY_DN80517_c0_g1_i1.p1 TRINITY_DN80517_c0_g1~~TRINITY_DN80517_c0_g1_i1.p1  ORF type:complete len:131 (-),score=8.00 TRINITY_DN80517_c0_g1_i1:31-423(-)